MGSIKNKITSIKIYSRGKNCDEFGNPYHAFKAVLCVSYVSYFKEIIIQQPMSYGDSSEWNCLEWALIGIKEATGWEFKPSDKRILHEYKNVKTFTELEHPESWRI